MNKRHYEHTLPNIRGSLSNTYEKNKFFQRVGWCSGRNHFYRNSEGVNRNLLQEFAKLVARSGRTCIRIPDPPTGKNAAF